jgi:hypothetical protein
MPYTDAPATVPGDHLRLLIGDTAAEALLSDNEVAFFLANNDDDPVAGALSAAKALAFRFAQLVDATEGDVSRSYSQKAKAYAELARSLAADVATAAATAVAPIVWAGGISQSEVDANAGDGDLVPRYFYEGMDSRPGTLDTRSGCP